MLISKSKVYSGKSKQNRVLICCYGFYGNVYPSNNVQEDVYKTRFLNSSYCYYYNPPPPTSFAIDINTTTNIFNTILRYTFSMLHSH